jgi:hypothetical protein
MQRLKRSILVYMLTTAFTTLLLAAQVAEAAPLTCGTWSVVPSPNVGQGGNDLFGVAAVSASDVWAVGHYTVCCYSTRTLIEHWSGSSWQVVKSPNVGRNSNELHSVAVISADNIWAVGRHYNSNGSQALIEHWNGSSWQIVKSPNPGSKVYELNAVAVVSADNIWAVGTYYKAGVANKTLIEQWNGSSWQVVKSPNVGSNYNELNAVSVVSANNIWAVGDYENTFGPFQTLIEQWNGSSWQVVSSLNVGLGYNQLFGVTVVSANDIWTVGTYTGSGDLDQTLTQHWNGSSWQVVKSPNAGSYYNDLYSVAAVSANNIWAVGTYTNGGNLGQTLTEQWNGTRWSIVPSPSPGQAGNQLFDVAVVSASNVWAVGTNNGQTLIEFYC